MKKFLALVLALVMVFALCACGKPAADAPKADTPKADTPKADTPAPATSDKAAEPTYKWRLGSSQADGNDIDITLDLFAQLINEKSNGAIEVTVYPGTMLGDDGTVTSMVQMGELELAITAYGILENYMHEFSVINLPGLWQDYDHVRYALTQAWGDTLRSACEGQNMYYLGNVVNGFMNIGTVGTPVACFEDMVGLNIRCIESPSTLTTLSSWGCNPVPMAFSELPTGLELGTVDGCFLNPMVFISTGIADILDYYTADWSVGIGLCPVIMNQELYNSLPDDIKQIVNEAWAEAEDDGWRRTNENQAANLEKLEKEHGVTIVHSTPEQIAAMDDFNINVLWPQLIELGVTDQATIDLILSYKK